MVAARIGYQPTPAARAPTPALTDAIGVIVSDIANPHFFGLIRGAGREAADVAVLAADSLLLLEEA